LKERWPKRPWPGFDVVIGGAFHIEFGGKASDMSIAEHPSSMAMEETTLPTGLLGRALRMERNQCLKVVSYSAQ
jgi:hypothetical protein